ncbi:uncharacterized protein BDZ99DRAFT_453844 [Mytilinidion resinicola]|uniref:Snf7-domain-containing protein n=1 Tax=Mytilinidion resinicola TaxID=574789 RepID=A0A6A6Y360_9PEZI|nr:uncharacterized protein BDZ99DRAFT_453844 [Mytilinidion resinicola]KAF2803079.1 hypothetical protein BDZ99DRAFT_453844 [Mytilinidion resinicola]
MKRKLGGDDVDVVRDAKRRFHLVNKPRRTMNELLAFILDHEEAFRSRGRLASLYSDFRSQIHTNPDGYHANIGAWKKALADAARAGVIPSQGAAHDLLTIRTGDELSRALATREYGRPMALGVVIGDAVSKKEMVPLNDFLSSKTSIYNRSWVPTPWQVISWGLRQLGVIGAPGSQESLAVGNFVVMANVEAAASIILKQMSSSKSNVDLVFSRSTFATEFANTLDSSHALTQIDLNILLTYLARDKQAISFDSKTVKFKQESQAVPSPITHQDATIANLRDLISSISTQIPPLTGRIATLDATARSAVASKTMTAAKSALRSKKLAEATLVRRTDTLAQLEEVLAKIEQAADQVEIIKVMEASATVLKGLHKEVGGAEGVEGVVDALKEEMSKVDEVSGIINEVGQEGVVDDNEVDEEFEALERVEREKQEKIEREKREQEEAEKTRVRLEELEKLDQERKEKKRVERERNRLEEEKIREVERKRQEEERTREAEAAQNASVDDSILEQASQEMSSMSLSETGSEQAEKPKEPVPAS